MSLHLARPKRPSLSRRNKPSFSSSSATSSSSSSSSDDSPRSKPQFKRFNRFSRPDIRQSLLQKILNKGSKGAKKNTLSLEEQEQIVERQKEAQLTSDSPASAADGSQLQDLSGNGVDPSDPDARLQTTLLVSTVYPETLAPSSLFLEVATIRSPYSFDVDDGVSSTRYVTVTRTFTTSSSPPPTARPTRTGRPDLGYKTSTPLFKVKKTGKSA